MSEWIVILQWQWPLVVVRRKPPPAPLLVPAPLKYPPVLVNLPDGSLGVLNHIKPNEPGMVGVRPVDIYGNYFANMSEHWSEAQRQTVPHEVAIALTDLKPVVHLPAWAK